MVFASPLPDVEIPDVPLTEYVLAHAERLGDKPALIDGGSGRTLTYAGLAGAVRSLAGGLSAKGFGRGDVLALMSPNLPEYAVIFHGVAMAGGTITTINPTYTQHEVHKQLVDSGATILVTIPMFLDVATQGGEAEGVTPVTALFGAPIAAQVPVESDTVVVLPYSSGTTGISKGVMLTHRNLIANVAQVLSAADISEDEKFIAVLPFFHIYGMQVLMNTGLRAGVTIITMPRFDLEEFLRLHQEHGITRSFVAPPIVVALAKHPIVDNYDLSALRQVFSGAAPLSAELSLECGARLGCEVVQGYGMTELSPVSHLTPPGNYKPGSCGVTAPNTLTMVVDPVSQQELGVDEDGEICIKGPQVMTGYLANQAATDAIFDREGWLHTGDIGHVDADGHMFIVDRLKELIKYKGFQVPPAELEALLLTHPAIADAAVVGLPDESAGEIPVAHVVLRPGAEATPEEIMEFVAGQVAHYKQVRQVVITDTIPKSASGKILRRLLKNPE
jgi:acyl-CoA synthetase (AMP-forming)/AMP-acid ligase II